jgi:hypothetical protein
MSSSSSKKKSSSRSSQGSLPNTRELLLVRPGLGTSSPLSSVSGSIGSIGLPGSDSSIESNGPELPNTSALLRVPLSPRSSSDSISAATYRGLSSSRSSRSRRRGRGRAGPASRRIMIEINDRVDGPTVYRVPKIPSPPRPLQLRPPRHRIISSSDSISAATYRGLSSSSSIRSRSRGRGRAGPASRRIMFRINSPAGPTVYGVPRIAPPPPPPPRSSSDSISAATYRGLSSSSSSRSRSRGRGRGRGRARPASKKIMIEIKDRVDGPTVYRVPKIAPPPRTRGVRMLALKRNSSSSSSSSSSSRRRSPSRSRTPSPK